MEVLDKYCFLIKQILDLKAQASLFEDIQSKDKRATTEQPQRALYPSPKTVQLGVNKPTVKYEFGEKTVYSDMVDKANTLLMKQKLSEVDLFAYKTITLSVIEYESGNHKLAAHIDHCNSFVYLLSLGCTANFFVKGPNMAKEKVFKFESGDLLVFDGSTAGNVLHGISSIDDDSTCPAELAAKFLVLKKHRYGVQLRVRFE